MLRSLLLVLSLSEVSSNRFNTDPIESNVSPGPTPAPTTPAPTPAPTPGTTAPTFLPTDAPSSQPTLKECALNPDGFYGSSSTFSEVVTYNYELETQPNTTDVNAIVSNLQGTVLNSLLPTLFAGDGCAARRVLRSSRRLAATGASILPEDVVIDNLCTVAKENAANGCARVEGKLTLFNDGNPWNGATLALTTIAQQMNDGNFNNADPNIVKVTYVNITPDPVEDPTPVENEGDDGNANNGIAAPIYVAIAAGAIVIVGAIFFYRRRRDNRDNDPDVESTMPTEAPNAPAMDFGTVQPMD